VLGENGLEVIANAPSEFAVMIRETFQDLGRGGGCGGADSRPITITVSW